MIRERKILELIEDVSYHYYRKTGDIWWLDLARMVSKKKGSERWWRK